MVLSLVERRQNHSTFFLRNRAELELIRRIVARAHHGSTIDVVVLACSNGAEVYSIAWVLKTVRPDLTINLRAVDISQDVLEFAKRGVYSLQRPDPQHGGRSSLDTDTYRDLPADYSPFERMSEHEKGEMFDRDGKFLAVKSWIKEGISWHCADAGDPELVSVLGRQDIVVANRFLCHMKSEAAERILRNVVRLVEPGGHLFVSGVDLDLRTRVAMEMKWKPVTELMEEIHDGDSSIRDGWPLEYWAKEPFQAWRSDAIFRYASAFKILSLCSFLGQSVADLPTV